MATRESHNKNEVGATKSERGRRAWFPPNWFVKYMNSVYNVLIEIKVTGLNTLGY